MSADDPAKDPKDWVVEGSKDGGSSWHILDQQINQLFKWRYEQKLYMIKSTAFPSNLFRFQFLAVRDVHSTGLQVGKIDLYAKNS
ncbi:peptide-N(4)-(N-acetyl-beta-glucosaminyl)asparagine amidase-like [Carica papaya]|uniref:peptide-N(4)-(N-acetyl-beta- glucosaminyl)asparagine amidase-like n=1 Tax=Carica papaya TaxID=3649 RepID=UPI000B8C8867|nr:peptide-N(4)-(N-acetyl-beta-glucosaminyl)asparagine amidase-like [Carica papaya]